MGDLPTESDRTTELLSLIPAGQGWGPLHHLVDLAAEVLQARVLRGGDPGTLSAPDRLRAAWPRRRRGSRDLVVIAARPSQLAMVNRAMSSRAGSGRASYDRMVGWVIDSFWTDEIPRIVKAPFSHYDQLWITDAELVGHWESVAAPPVDWLPWGSDVLGALRRPRTVDVQRLGRQPPAWDNDDQVTGLAADHGLRFAGRPSFGSTPAEEYESVREALARARVVLAFSNTVAPGGYTHPTHEYLTGRWTDALAHGCLIAGVPPRSEAARVLLPPEALIQVDPDQVDGGLARIAEHLAAAPQELANQIQRRAAQEIDWRRRLAVIADFLGPRPPSLVRSLAALDQFGPPALP